MATTPIRPIRMEDDLWFALLEAVQNDPNATSVSAIARTALWAWLQDRQA
jgi:hypothetical protein